MTEQSVYMLIKLGSGEQLMATVDYETDDALYIRYPFLVSTHRTLNAKGNQVEHITAGPWCNFVQEKFYEIDKRHVMFLNPLHELIIPQYLGMVESYNKEVEVATDPETGEVYIKDTQDEYDYRDDWVEVDDVKDSVEQMVNSITTQQKTLEEAVKKRLELEEKRKHAMIMEGNDTIN